MAIKLRDQDRIRYIKNNIPFDDLRSIKVYKRGEKFLETYANVKICKDISAQTGEDYEEVIYKLFIQTVAAIETFKRKGVLLWKKGITTVFNISQDFVIDYYKDEKDSRTEKIGELLEASYNAYSQGGYSLEIEEVE